MATDLYLVRHGEAVSNVEPVIAGLRGDRGLTELGHRQAALLEARLRAEPLEADVLYVSTLLRALETGDYVARALGLPVRTTDDLHELRPGEADGQTIEEWRTHADREVPPRDPFQAFSPGGESWAAFLLRAQQALSDLVARHPGETVVAVCHAGVLEASFCLAFGLGPSAPRVQVAPSNTSITHWRHQHPPQGTARWTLMGFNDARHLDPDPVHDSGRDFTGEV
ncbi:MAG: histidine phosphatase family protein [Marmoricola sp.]|nr:histidine phosphatase family protein [Marmoricola sp.]